MLPRCDIWARSKSAAWPGELFGRYVCATGLHCGPVSRVNAAPWLLKEDCLKEKTWREVRRRNACNDCGHKTCVILLFQHCNMYRTVCSHLRMFIISRREAIYHFSFLFYGLPAFNLFVLEVYLCACVCVVLLAGLCHVTTESNMCRFLFFPPSPRTLLLFVVHSKTFLCIDCCSSLFGWGPISVAVKCSVILP